MTEFNTFFSVFFSLLAVSLVVVMAYLTSRYVSKRYASMAMGKYMRVVDRLVIGQGQQLLLVETGDVIICLGVSGQHIEKLCQLSKGELVEMIRTQPEGDFAGVLFEVIKKKLPFGQDKNTGEGDHR